MNRVKRESNLKKIIKTVLISLIIVVLYEIFMRFVLKKTSIIYIYNIVLETVIVSFVLLHFVIGIERLYSIIVNNRYKLSIIFIILSTIFGFFGKSVGFKEWIFNGNIPLSLYWNIKFYALILISYELFNLITNKQGLAVIGTFLVTLSGYVQWNFNCINILILGELMVLLINILLKQDKLKFQLIISGIITICYAIYRLQGTSLAVSFEFAFIPILIWIFIKNKEYLKDNLRSIIFLLISIVLGFIIYKLFITKSSFVFIESVIENEYGTKYLFSYLYNILLPFKDLNNNSIYGSFISLFPFPMIISLYYIYKSEEHTEFLFPLSAFSAIGTIFCITGFPNIICKIIGLTNVSTNHMAIAVNLLNVFLLFYILSNINEELFTTKHAMRFTIIICCLISFVKYPNIISTKKYLSLFVTELAALGFLFLNFEDKKYKKVLLSLLLLLTLISGLTVNKLTKSEPKIEKHYDTYCIVEKINYVK